MSREPIDLDARRRVTERFDESLLVEAGAGTGKTTALVDRIVASLRLGHATIDDLAVVTFTNDAAAELVSRVRERLERALAEATSEDERERLRDALSTLYRSRISTLHVFATTLLRERPVEARVDPGLRAMTEVERAERFEVVYGAWLADVLSGDDPDVAQALNRGLQLKQLRKLCERVDSQRHAFPLKSAGVVDPDHAVVAAMVAQHLQRLGELAPSCHDPSDKGILQWPAIQEFAAALAGASDAAQQERIALERWPDVKGNRGNQSNWAAAQDCKDWKEEVGALVETVTAYRRALRSASLSRLVPLAVGFSERFSEDRRVNGLADFDDLLLWARDLLRRDRSARRWLRERYRHVLVDEFQDTDPLQAEIALLLTSADDGSDWTAMRPSDGALVVVGDPKQSIYRFRRGDLATYDAVKAGPLAGAQPQLRQNFRSVGGILAWSNRIFASVFGTGERGVQAPHVALEAYRPDRVGPRSPVVVVRDPVAGPKEKAEVRAGREVDVLARTLRAVVLDGWTVVGEDGAERAADWRDIAVIIPARTRLETMLEAFDRHGVPYRASRGTGIFQQPEIAELVSILRAVDDPSDGVATVGALRSDAFGCSADDLVLHRAKGYRFDPRHVPDDAPDRVREGLRAIAGWRRQRRGLSLPELVGRVLDESGLVELALERDGGAQTAGNLLQVVEEARAFSSTGGGLRAFARWLAERREVDTEAAEAAIADVSDSVVRIVTIHGAKGLEFPIVALASLDTRGSARTGDAISRPGLLEVRLSKEWETDGFEPLAQEEKALLERERERLLYVGVTRARDHLIVPTTRDRDTREGHAETLGRFLPDDGPEQWGTEIDGVFVLDPRSLPDEPPKPPAAERAAAVDVDRLVAEEEAWVLAGNDLRRRAGTGLVQTVASSVQPIDRIRPLASIAADEDDEAADLSNAPPLTLGTAMHHVLERLALDGSEDPRPLVESMCSEAGIVGAEDELERLVLGCLAAPVMRRAAAADAVHREVAFTVAADGAGYAVGRIDLVLVEGDELVVVDYKSDQVGDASPATLEAVSAVHSGQGAVYALALERATGVRVREVVWVYGRAGAEWVQVVDDQTRQLAAGAIASGETYGGEG